MQRTTVSTKEIPASANAMSWSPLPNRSARVLQRKCACGGEGGGSGECEACRNKRETAVRRREADSTTPGFAPPIVQEVLRASGQPLDDATRAFMEPRFGSDFSQVRAHAHGTAPVPVRLAIGAAHDEFEQEADTVAQRALSRSAGPPGARSDFSGVRIHTDAHAAESAQAVGAHAYTVGNHIVFGAGQFAPGTSAGRCLLAHELTHVMQQTGGRLNPPEARTKALKPERDEEDRTRNEPDGQTNVTSTGATSRAPILQRDFALEPPRPRAVSRVLTAAQMQAAIEFNQRVVAVIGASGIRELRDVLGISPDPAVIDEDFVSAVSRWQAMQGLGQDGKLGAATAHPLFREIGAEQVGRGQLVKGPAYHATAPLTPPVVGGRQDAGFRFEAEFADDPANGLYASCCEVHQFIQWDAAYAAAGPGGPPHAGFPAGTAAGTWLEDRDGADTRYGHRTGPHSALQDGDEYVDNTAHRNAAFGHIYRGRDFPGTSRHAGHFRFMVRAFDVCNGNRALGDDFLRITWA